MLALSWIIHESLPGAAQYLKPGITFKILDIVVTKQSGLDAWKQMQKARARLFDTIYWTDLKGRMKLTAMPLLLRFI